MEKERFYRVDGATRDFIANALGIVATWAAFLTIAAIVLGGA